MSSTKGQLIIISSPSGGGKNSVINALLEKFSGSTRLITTTTRPMRPGEKDGVDYFFITREEFERKLEIGDFVEYNNYAGNLYGTDKVRLNEFLQKNSLVFSQIEVNGKNQMDKVGIKNVSFFLLPESLEILGKRIEKRGGLDAETIRKRLEIAKIEVEASVNYDYKIVNHDGAFNKTVEEIERVILSLLKTA